MKQQKKVAIGDREATIKLWATLDAMRELRTLTRLVGKDVLGSLLGAEDPEMVLAAGGLNTWIEVLRDTIDVACGEAKMKRKLEILGSAPGYIDPDSVDAMLAELYPYDGFDELALHWILLSEVEVDGVLIDDAQKFNDSGLRLDEVLFDLVTPIFKENLGPLFDRLGLLMKRRQSSSKSSTAS